MSGLEVSDPDTRPSVAIRLLERLGRRGETLATAESLSGGLIGSLLTEVPGASASYLGGVITYATRLKGSLAGVEADVLETYGPVARVTAEQMALGVARLCRADWGLSVTGVAGPDRQDGHPVGQVFVGIAHASTGQVRVYELSLAGGRNDIRRAAAERALELADETLGMQAAVEGVDQPSSPGPRRRRP